MPIFFCRQYREYLENLLEYLIYFFERTEPLQDLDRIFTKVCFSLVIFLNIFIFIFVVISLLSLLSMKSVVFVLISWKSSQCSMTCSFLVYYQNSDTCINLPGSEVCRFSTFQFWLWGIFTDQMIFDFPFSFKTKTMLLHNFLQNEFKGKHQNLWVMSLVTIWAVIVGSHITMLYALVMDSL